MATIEEIRDPTKPPSEAPPQQIAPGQDPATAQEWVWAWVPSHSPQPGVTIPGGWEPRPKFQIMYGDRPEEVITPGIQERYYTPEGKEVRIEKATLMKAEQEKQFAAYQERIEREKQPITIKQRIEITPPGMQETITEYVSAGGEVLKTERRREFTTRKFVDPRTGEEVASGEVLFPHKPVTQIIPASEWEGKTPEEQQAVLEEFSVQVTPDIVEPEPRVEELVEKEPPSLIPPDPGIFERPSLIAKEWLGAAAAGFVEFFEAPIEALVSIGSGYLPPKVRKEFERGIIEPVVTREPIKLFKGQPSSEFLTSVEQSEFVAGQLTAAALTIAIPFARDVSLRVDEEIVGVVFKREAIKVDKESIIYQTTPKAIVQEATFPYGYRIEPLPTTIGVEIFKPSTEVITYELDIPGLATETFRQEVPSTIGQAIEISEDAKLLIGTSEAIRISDDIIIGGGRTITSEGTKFFEVVGEKIIPPIDIDDITYSYLISGVSDDVPYLGVLGERESITPLFTPTEAIVESPGISIPVTPVTGITAPPITLPITQVSDLAIALRQAGTSPPFVSTVVTTSKIAELVEPTDVVILSPSITFKPIEDVSTKELFVARKEIRAVTVTETITESITEPITESIISPTIKPILKPITMPITEPITKPITKPITEPVIKPITEPIIKPITEPIIKPITEPVIKPITEPITEPIVPTPPVPTPPFIPPPITPTVGLPFLVPTLFPPKRRRLVRKRKVRKPLKPIRADYTPSLRAALFRERGVKPRKIAGKYYSPLTARPIPIKGITRPKKKKKVKKKKALFAQTVGVKAKGGSIYKKSIGGKKGKNPFKRTL